MVHLFDNSTTTAYEDIANHLRITLRNLSTIINPSSGHHDAPICPPRRYPSGLYRIALTHATRDDVKRATNNSRRLRLRIISVAELCSRRDYWDIQKAAEAALCRRSTALQACCDMAAGGFGTRTVHHEQDDLFDEGKKHSTMAS